MIKTEKAIGGKTGGGTKVEADIRGLKVVFDKPEESGGENLGPTPGEMMLAALGACQAMTVASLAAKMRIDLKQFWIEVEGDYDEDGLAGKNGAKQGEVEMRYVMHFETDAPKEKMEKIAMMAQKYCHVGATLENGVPLVFGGVVME